MSTYNNCKSITLADLRLAPHRQDALHFRELMLLTRLPPEKLKALLRHFGYKALHTRTWILQQHTSWIISQSAIEQFGYVDKTRHTQELLLWVEEHWKSHIPVTCEESRYVIRRLATSLQHLFTLIEYEPGGFYASVGGTGLLLFDANVDFDFHLPTSLTKMRSEFITVSYSVKKRLLQNSILLYRTDIERLLLA